MAPTPKPIHLRKFSVTKRFDEGTNECGVIASL